MKQFWMKFAILLKRWYVLLILLSIDVSLVLIILMSYNGETSRGSIRLYFDVSTLVNYINLF